MRRTLLFLLLLLGTPAAAEPVRLYDGALLFDLPSAFRPMTAAEIATKYPSPQPPQHGYTDSDGLGVTIAVTRSVDAGFTPDNLTAIGEATRQDIADLSGVTMHRSGLVVIGSARWYAIDFVSATADEPVENRMRMIIRPGYLLGVSVNAVRHVFPQREAELLRVLESLKLD